MSAVTAFSGHVPANYETYLGPLFFEPYAVDLSQRISELKIAGKVLEIACGTGRVTKHLADQLPADSSLTATDLNPDMLAVAKTVVQHPRINWQVADAHQLPFENNTFQLVVCQYGVMFFQDKQKAFHEISRVLTGGGVFLFNTWKELQHNSLSNLAQSVLEETYPDDPPRFLEKGPYSFFDTEKIKAVLEQAGFINITIESVTKTSMAQHVDHAVNGILEGTPNFGYIMERDVPITVVKDRLKAVLVSHFGETDLPLRMEAYVIKASKD